MTKIEEKVGHMLLNYCEAISEAKQKSLSKAGQKWKVRIHKSLLSEKVGPKRR